jgi:hypothetical protein
MRAYYSKPDILYAKIRNGTFKEEFQLAMTLLRKGRLKLSAPKSKAVKEIQKAYSQTRGEIP